MKYLVYWQMVYLQELGSEWVIIILRCHFTQTPAQDHYTFI